MSKTIVDLREALFDTIAAVRNGQLDLDKARSINEVAKTIVDTAKVEVEFVRVTEGTTKDASGFLKQPPELPPGITGIHQHRITG